MKKTSKICLEIEKDSGVFQFFIPEGAPIGDAFDAVIQCWGHLSNMNNEALEKNKEFLEKAFQKTKEEAEKETDAK